MTFLPIIERELRVRARGRATYWTRFAAAALATLLCLPQMFSSYPAGTPAALGQVLLSMIVGAAFLLCCAACLLTSDAISSERREGTLGLLLLTEVNPLDVLVGKLGSAGLTSLCALLTFLPMLMITVLAGGVTGGEAFRKELVLLETLFLALAAGVWASARGREGLRNSRNALLALVAVLLGPLLAQGLFASGGGIFSHLALLSPLGTMRTAADALYKFTPEPYWISLLLVQAAGWTLLVWTRWRLRRVWQEERGELNLPADPAVPPSADAAAPEPPVEADCLSAGLFAQVPPPADVFTPAALPPLLPPHRSLDDDTDPIAWRLRRQRGWRAMIWVGAFAGFTSYLFYPLMLLRFRLPSYISFASPLTLATTLTQGALFAWAASRFFVEARRSGELELLLSTPAGAQQLVPAQWQLLKRAFRWPLVIIIAPALLQGLILLSQFGYAVHPGGSYLGQYGVSLLLRSVNTVLAVGAICWLGLFFGLRAGSQSRAVMWTVALAMGLPYLISTLASTLFLAFFRSSTSFSFPPYWIMFCLPQLLDLLLYLALITLARRHLRRGGVAGEPMPFDLRQAVESAARDVAAALRKVRHWTPS
jgi:ABC-type transport system involved in multi-copper enzyme maturation permease subunit